MKTYLSLLFAGLLVFTLTGCMTNGQSGYQNSRYGMSNSGQNSLVGNLLPRTSQNLQRLGNRYANNTPRLTYQQQQAYLQEQEFLAYQREKAYRQRMAMQNDRQYLENNYQQVSRNASTTPANRNIPKTGSLYNDARAKMPPASEFKSEKEYQEYLQFVRWQCARAELERDRQAVAMTNPGLATMTKPDAEVAAKDIEESRKSLEKLPWETNAEYANRMDTVAEQAINTAAKYQKKLAEAKR